MRSLARTPDPAVTAAAARPRPARAEPDARAGRDAERIAARVLERAPAPAGLGDGAPLGAATRADLEARFGRDLGAVRVHSDDDAHGAAAAVGARAFTVGRHVVFAHGAYAPETEAGRRLLAHELVHVIQQDAIPAPDHAAGPTPRQRVPAGRVVQRSPAAFTAIEVIAGLAQTASFAAELHSQSFERIDAGFLGAGDILSAALAALLATGSDLTEAVGEALLYLDQALDHGFRPGMGRAVADRLFWASAEADDDGADDAASPDPLIDIPHPFNETKH